MPRSPKLGFVEKNSGMLIEELLLGGVDPEHASLNQILELCLHYRRVGLCRWLARGDPDLLFAELGNSAWVFAAWSASHADDDKRSSRMDPYLDALAADATAAARAIIAASRTTWNSEVEYEEDFCYARILQHLLLGEADQARELLARWMVVSGGGEPRFLICQALLDTNKTAFMEALELQLEETLAGIRERQHTGAGDPDAAVTTDRLSLEALALSKLARTRGIASSVRHLLLHQDLLSPPRAPLPGPQDWKTIENHRDLG